MICRFCNEEYDTEGTEHLCKDKTLIPNVSSSKVYFMSDLRPLDFRTLLPDTFVDPSEEHTKKFFEKNFKEFAITPPNLEIDLVGKNPRDVEIEITERSKGDIIPEFHDGGILKDDDAKPYVLRGCTKGLDDLPKSKNKLAVNIKNPKNISKEEIDELSSKIQKEIYEDIVSNFDLSYDQIREREFGIPKPISMEQLKKCMIEYVPKKPSIISRILRYFKRNKNFD
jgi:hypothetical protein